MKSPFPGMDPYLEAYWRDVHSRLVLYACDQLQPQLGGDLRARVEERVVLDAPNENDVRFMVPDLSVVEERGKSKGVAPADSSVAVAEPIIIDRILDQPTETFVEIIDRRRNRVVTVVEVVSRSNKRPGKDRKKYREKQRQLARARVSLVEIDLLRRGKRTFRYPEGSAGPDIETSYAALVHRAYKEERFEYYPLELRRRLPAIRIPLRKGDVDVVLNIQMLVDLAYTNGAYDGDIDYSLPPVPPLNPDEDAWADELLKAAKKR